MKILVIRARGIPDIQGGVETHCQELYPRINSSMTVLIRTPYVKNIEITNYKGVELVPIDTPKKSGLEAIVHTFKGCFFAFKNKSKIDIIHIHNIGLAIFIPLLKLFGFKVVVTYHSQNYHHKKWGIVARVLFKFGEYFTAEMADKIIYLSNNIKEFVEKKYEVKNGIIIYNGVDVIEKSVDFEYISSLRIETGKYCIDVINLYDFMVIHHYIDIDFKLYPREGSLDYINRPQGIMGQGSITSSFLVILVLSKDWIESKISIKNSILEKIFYLGMFTVGIITQLSGSGYLAYLIYFLTKLKFKSIASMLSIGIVLFLIASSVEIPFNLNKISTAYLTASYIYFTSLIMQYLLSIDSMSFFYGMDIFPIDLGLIYLLALNGIVYFIIFNILFFYIIYQKKDFQFSIILILSLIFSFHYPMIIYFLPFTYIIILSNTQLKDNYENYHNRI